MKKHSKKLLFLTNFRQPLCGCRAKKMKKEVLLLMKKQEKISISCAFSKRKMEALEMYASQKDVKLEEQIALFLEAKYKAIVPNEVRKYIALFVEGQADTPAKTDRKPRRLREETQPESAPVEAEQQPQFTAEAPQNSPSDETAAAPRPAPGEPESAAEPSESASDPGSFWG